MLVLVSLLLLLLQESPHDVDVLVAAQFNLLVEFGRAAALQMLLVAKAFAK